MADFTGKKIVLIDGHSILNRAYFGIPDLTNAEGFHTNAIYGFLNIMFKILDEEKPEYLTVAFDRSEPTFRHQMFDAYKGTRKPMDDELRQQIPVMKDVLHAMNIKTMEKPGLEADDILGTIAGMAERAGMTVSIISGDRDLLQLATDKVKIRIPKTKKTGTEVEDYNTAEVIEKYLVTPKEFIDVKALMGDASDNIPGVPGIGEKGATQLIAEYKSIENAHEHAQEIKAKRAREGLLEHYDLAVLSKTLATIEVNADIDYSLEDAAIENMFNQDSYVLFKKLELKNMISRFDVVDTPEADFTENFKVISDFGDVESFFAGFKTDRCAVSVFEKDRNLYGIGIVADESEINFIPCRYFITEAYLEDKLERLVAGVKTLITNDLKGLLKRINIEEGKDVFDTGLAAYVLNPLKSEYAYDDIANDFMGLQNVLSQAAILGKIKLEKAVESSPELIEKIGCYQAYVTFAGAAVLSEKLKETGMDKLYEEIEIPLVYVLDDMEKEGIRADGEALAEYGKKLSGRIDELQASIYELAGEEFNINSPKQLGVILFEKLNLPNGKKTKTGYSTAADVLEKLASEHEIVSQILEYRQLTKLKSTYADGLIPCIKEDGRIHTTFNQTITATGRLSSTEPNLQNIPVRMELGRLIRKVFIPKDGFVFIDSDYSQIELRVLAHMSGDENLIAAYRQAEDIHRITASQVFHVPLDEVTPLQRRNAKAVNFGIVYGISSFGLSQDLSISRKEAEQYIERYFETYPGINAFLKKLVSDAKETGCAMTMYGRRRPVPEISSSNFMQRQFGERIAMNSPIQGTAADIIKIAMINVYKELKANNLKSKLILQVHDELLIETAEDEVDKVKEILGTQMKKAADLAVELEIDMNVGKDWFDAH